MDFSKIECDPIPFNTEPAGWPHGIDEQMVKKLVEDIDKETKEAGLPWWAGLFNPKIIEVARSGHNECKCAETTTEEA